MKFTPYEQPKKSSSLRRLGTLSAVFCVSVVLLFVVSRTAHASLVSFMDTLFGSQQVSAEVPKPLSNGNFQTIALLQAATNVDPNPDKSADVVPVDGGGEILVADLAGMNDGTDSINTQISTYQVQADDSLSSIADMFGLSINTIKQVNGLTSNTIVPGRVLTILPVDGMLYTVQSGDTVGSIAKKYNATQDDILTYNGLKSTSPITKGQQFVIPHGNVPTIQAKSYIALHAKVPSFEPLLDPVWNWPTAASGYYSCPVPGAVLTQGLHGHNGVDLAIRYGTPILAAAGGTVAISKSDGRYNGGYGNFVMLSHGNGSQTLYAHMSKTAVSLGDHVSAGQVIGYVGLTGLTTGAHLHFEIRNYTNPFASVACR